MARHKNGNWNLPDTMPDWKTVTIPLLMDIRDELQAIRRLVECYRLPRALDAVIELGADARRRKRKAAAERKAARQ